MKFLRSTKLVSANFCVIIGEEGIFVFDKETVLNISQTNLTCLFLIIKPMSRRTLFRLVKIFDGNEKKFP